MSEDYYIPFEIQSDIIKRLPVKSLLQFRSVSKQWKSFIDNPKFIKTYHINHPNPKHHLLVHYYLNSVETYTSIVDDNTFPQQKFPMTIPEPLNKFKCTRILGSIDGMLSLYGWYNDEELETWMVVLWNPSLRKCVGIPVPNVYFRESYRYTRIAFGVCPDTKDPKLVKINVVLNVSWEVQVFTLSSRVWRTVFTEDALSKPCYLSWNHVFIDGLIYWWKTGSFVLSFDMKSEKFGEVCLSERLAIPFFLEVVKVNDSLGLLHYSEEGEGEMSVCGVWIRKDGLNKPFTKIYTVKEGQSILGFRNNGEIVIKREDDDSEGSQIEVYEPSSGRTTTVGINGDRCTFTVMSYMETLHLLDESNSIIH